MRYGIFSDVHANLEALKAVLCAYKKENIDIYLCIGDVVGYGADPNECVELVKKTAMITVAGNHDWASVDLFPVDYFNPQAKQAILWTKDNLSEQSRYFLESLKPVYKNKDLILVHGTLENPAEFDYMLDGYTANVTFQLMDTHLCFVGHSHIAGIFIQDQAKRIYYQEVNHLKLEDKSKYIINVGSVGQPRDGNPSSAYCIYDTDKKEIFIKRVDYDIQTAYTKILTAGLPKSLAERILVGG
ncbi:MAG: metallophosphatase family protein [Candidatus Omnitrophica bacterium]|nr:metallophosphatase family protein [Candidatus Omnitrophota bacterium]